MRNLLNLIASASFILTGTQVCAQIQFNSSDDPIRICENIFEFSAYQNNTDSPFDTDGTCLDYPHRLSSVWLEFGIESQGDISFILSPLNENDDIDFVLYRIDNSNPSSNNPDPVRCVSTGANLDKDFGEQKHCLGATGLFPGASDLEETSGCSALKDNFVSSIQGNQDERYLLQVTNYKSSDGFSLEFIGKAILAKQSDCQSTVSTLDPEANNFSVSTVSPNPLVKIGYVEIDASKSMLVRTHIVNLNGTLLQTQEHEILAGKSKIHVDAENLQAGIYLVTMHFGEKVITRKFVKI